LSWGAMHLHAVGHFHPENVITNDFLQSLGLDTTDAWIVERVGIHQRHTVLPLDYIRETRNRDVRAALEAAQYTNAATGAKAATLALERAGLKPSDIGLVVAGGCSPDECIPAEACRIADALGIEAPGLDLNSACSSFCTQLYFLEGMRPERLPDYVLVVNPENTTRVVDYADRSSCILWGDGTSAAIVSPRVPGRWRITETLLRGDPSGWEKVRIPRAGHFTQQGKTVQAFAIKRATELLLELRARYVQGGEGRSEGDVTFIGHQANLRMLQAVQQRAEVPQHRHLFNVDQRGNCGASGAPTVFSEHWQDPSLGDAVAMTVVGAGLTWSGALFERNPTVPR